MLNESVEQIEDGRFGKFGVGADCFTASKIKRTHEHRQSKQEMLGPVVKQAKAPLN